MEEANKLIGAGKKHLVMGKVVEAVSSLQEACGMLAKKYGDTADECGEAFYWCGKALLDLARMENSVLGNALEGVPEGDEDEEKPKDSNVDSTETIDEKTRDELRVQVYDAMAEKKEEDKGKKNGDTEEEQQSEGKEKNGDIKAEAGDQQQKEGKKEGEEGKKETDESKSAESEEKTEKDEKAEKEPEEEKADDGEEGEEKEDDGEDAEMECDTEEQGEGDGAAEKSDDEEEEEIGNLQLAWEMLEVAKVIFKRKETEEDQLMAAQAHLKLGEVSAESGNYTQAIEDFQECLKLQVKHLDADSRLLAETHFQLGATYSMSCQYNQAIKALNSSISVIKSRLGKLEELLKKAEGPEALPGERKELEELQALLLEIQERVEDATEAQKLAKTAAQTVKGVLGEGSSSSAFPGSTVQNRDPSPSSKVNGTSANGVSSTNGHASTAAVSDITHLVRKKRKPEESPVKEGGMKKVKPDADQTNGEQKPHTNGETNGHSAEVKSQ